VARLLKTVPRINFVKQDVSYFLEPGATKALVFTPPSFKERVKQTPPSI
jgi:hypothetical protein